MKSIMPFIRVVCIVILGLLFAFLFTMILFFFPAGLDPSGGENISRIANTLYDYSILSFPLLVAISGGLALFIINTLFPKQDDSDDS